MLPSAPQPLVEARPQACALASRPRPSPVSGLLQTPLLGVRSSVPLHFDLQYKRLAWRPAVRRALAPSPLVAPHLRFDLSEADSCRLRYCKGHG
jgi:hypothetical protein